MTETAFPENYRISQQCLTDNPNDPGRALVCSTNNNDLLSSYDKFKSVEECNDNAKSGDDDRDAAVAQCLGDATLGENERYYLSCVTKNDSEEGAAVCALDKNLTPEQQIALSCAVESGGQPYAFAVCTGGQLLARELDKCFNGGIATNNGCFGPNNEYRKFLRGIDGQMQHTFGNDSVVYDAYKSWQDNVLAPGPNNEVVKALNNGISDINNGPGPNNEFVKAGNSLSHGVQSVANAFGL